MALCAYPINLEKVGGIVPCGQCNPCRQNRRRQKTARLVLEASQHEHILFVTLTYEDVFLPREYHCPNTDLSYGSSGGVLDPSGLKNFIKRLRRKAAPLKLRFFACGEYGEEKARPHYHLVIFGLPYEKKEYIYQSWTDPVSGYMLCDPKFLDIQVPQNNHDVAQYVCSYVMKKMTKPDDPRLKGRTPEFFRQSKGIGLPAVEGFRNSFKGLSGRAYIEREGDIARSFKIDGKSYPIDRYMRQKILSGLPEKTEKEIKENGQTRYQEEMQALRARAVKNKKIPWALKFGNIKQREYALEMQFALEKEQELLNNAARQQLFNNRKTSL